MDFGDFMGLALTLSVLFVVFPAVLFSGIARVKAAKAKAGAAGDSLRMSELTSMIDTAVQRETAALRERIEVLEEIATSRNDDFRLLNASPPVLSVPESEHDGEVPGTRSRTNARA
jgi:hypothetical protein